MISLHSAAFVDLPVRCCPFKSGGFVLLLLLQIILCVCRIGITVRDENRYSDLLQLEALSVPVCNTIYYARSRSAYTHADGQQLMCLTS